MGFCDVLLYINGIFCYVAGYSALSVTFGDISPRGGAKAYPNTRIGAFLPLPAGEVAMPQALTERGIYPPCGGAPMQIYCS